VATATQPQPAKKDKRPNTAPFKVVPETRELRDRIRQAAADFGKTVDRSKPLTRETLQAMAEGLLRQMDLGEQYLGFTMVAITNEFWRDQVQAVDFKRRLLLLPHCLKNAEGCPADYDEFGLDCKKCGACSVADFKIRAEELGYKVLVSEGTPIVLKIIVSGHVDAIVGVACLNVLEKALDKVLLTGVPCVAAPLLSSNCKSTSVDDDWVAELIELRSEPPQAKTKTYVHLMRAAHQLFETPELERLAPRARSKMPTPPVSPPRGGGDTGGAVGPDPLLMQENIAYDWLAQGGKRSRPFITLAVYDALKGAPGTMTAESVALSDSVRRAALAIETFHKASLVHDDIEDDDTFRYGRETLHRQYGVSTAINVGDYLIGLGYRLVSRERKELGGDCTADIIDRLADAHIKLSEGQGAELLWRDSFSRDPNGHGAFLTPLDALKIYALKTAPAFEAALYAGVRLAGPAEPYDKAVADFSRHLGIAFQIQNDLNDWAGDDHNKLVAGQDVLSARPTLLLALALEGCSAEERQELLGMVHDLQARQQSADQLTDGESLVTAALQRARQIFTRAQVFDKAEKLIEKSRARAEAVADEVEPVELRELLYYLVDTILDGPCEGPAGVTTMVQLGVA
jgi:geranylgeranyl pyrophosphate synthase